MSCFGQSFIYLTYFGDQRVSAVKCCASDFPNEVIKSWSFDEFLKIQHLEAELKGLRGLIPATHNFGPRPEAKVACGEEYLSCRKELFNVDIVDIGIALDLYCDAKCSFCLVNNKCISAADKKTLHSIYSHTLKKISEGAWRRVYLSDRGEPGLFETEIVNWIDSLTQSNIKIIQAATNGDFLSPKIVDTLKNWHTRTGGEFQVTISLNASNRELRKSIMKIDNFDSTIKGLQEVLQTFSIPPMLSFVACNENKHDIIPFYEFASKFTGCQISIRADCFHFNELMNTPEWKEWEKYKEEHHID